MCTKADEAEIFRFSAFEGAGKDIPLEMEHGTLQPAQCLSKKLLASQYWCWCEKQEETKKNRVWQQEMVLITSSRKHYLPSFPFTCN